MVVAGGGASRHSQRLIDARAKDVARGHGAGAVGLSDQLVPIIEEAGHRPVDGLAKSSTERIVGVVRTPKGTRSTHEVILAVVGVAIGPISGEVPIELVGEIRTAHDGVLVQRIREVAGGTPSHHLGAIAQLIVGEGGIREDGIRSCGLLFQCLI